jgi:hypothetical protein
MAGYRMEGALPSRLPPCSGGRTAVARRSRWHRRGCGRARDAGSAGPRSADPRGGTGHPGSRVPLGAPPAGGDPRPGRGNRSQGRLAGLDPPPRVDRSAGCDGTPAGANPVMWITPEARVRPHGPPRASFNSPARRNARSSAGGSGPSPRSWPRGGGGAPEAACPRWSGSASRIPGWGQESRRTCFRHRTSPGSRLSSGL